VAFIKYYCDIKSRKMRWGTYIAKMGQIRNAYIILGEKSEEKRCLNEKIMLN
jgi:hypothetical protein